MHMKWSLDVQFKTRIRPAALSAIFESHESMVTAIQWIHPMNEVSQSKSKSKIVLYGEYKLINLKYFTFNLISVPFFLFKLIT